MNKVVKNAGSAVPAGILLSIKTLCVPGCLISCVLPNSIYDSPCPDAVSDVNNLRIPIIKSLMKVIDDWCIGPYAKADKAIVKGEFCFYAVLADEERGFSYLCQSGTLPTELLHLFSINALIPLLETGF